MESWQLVALLCYIHQMGNPASALLDPTNYADLYGSTCFGSQYVGTDPQQLVAWTSSNNYTLTVDSNEAHTYMAENFKYMFQCCGLVTEWQMISAKLGNIQLQVWRRLNATTYIIVGENYFTITAPDEIKTYTVNAYDQILVRKGDFIGWHNQGTDMIKYYSDRQNTDPVGASNELENLFRRENIYDLFKGDTHDWSESDAYNDRLYAIQAKYEAATNAPSFASIQDITVPDYIENGKEPDTLWRFSYSDADYNDNSSLTIIKTSTSKFYNTDLPSGYISAVNQYRPQTINGNGNELRYFVFDLCYNTASATVSVNIVPTDLVIDNLDATFTISVNDGYRLLHTITITDPTDEVWCKEVAGSVWDSTRDVPFMLRAITSTSTNVEYGFYLLEDPNHNANSYILEVECTENVVPGTTPQTVTGTITVYVTQNQPPVFTNLDAATTLDADTAFIGDIVYTVSASDPEGDTIQFTGMTCKYDGGSTVDTTTFTMLKNGQVLLKKFLSRSDKYQFDCVITAEDESPSTYTGVFPPNSITGNLHISLSNINHPVSIENMPPITIEIQENMPVGTSIWKFKYHDVDNGDLDVKTWSMSIDNSEASRYFYLDPDTGLFSLAFSEINYLDVYSSPTYTLTITVGDVKSTASGTFSITVINENEPPWFTMDYYVLDNDEGAGGTSLTTGENDLFEIEDEDLDETVSGEDHTYSIDCGTNTHRFYMDPDTGGLQYEGDYDLDVAGTPSEVECTITVTDKFGLTDTAELYIFINNVNEYTPQFTRSNYTFYLSLTTLVGTYLATLSAVDLDSSDDDDNVITYMIDDATDPNGLLTINNDGALYLRGDLDADWYYGMEVLAMNYKHSTTSLTGTTTVNIVVPGTTTVTTTTTDRNTGFYENQWSYYWLLATLFGAILIITSLALACFKICRLSRIGPCCYAFWNKICFPPKEPPPRGFGDLGYDLASFGHRHKYADEDEEVDGWLPSKQKAALKKNKKHVTMHDRRFGTPNHGYEAISEVNAQPIYEMFRVPSAVPHAASYLEPHRGTKQPAGGDRWKDRRASRR